MTSQEIIQEVIKELEYCKKEDTMYEAETNLLLPDMEQVLKDLEVLEILKPFLKKVLEINEDGTEVFFKAVRYFNGYINGNWNETEQIKKNKQLKAWLDA